MPRDPFAGGAFEPGGIADPESDDDGGDSGGGGRDRDRDRDRDDDPPDPDPGSVTRDRGGAGAGGGGEPTVGVGGSDDGGSTGPSRQGRDDRTDGDSGATITDPAPAPDPDSGSGGSPGGSSPPLDDVGGPSGAAPDPEPDDPADIVSGEPGPVFGDPANDDGSSSGSDTGPQFGPGPNTDGGLGDEDPGGDGDEIIDGTRRFVDRAEDNDEIVERATTGGLLSERGESAGLFPAESRASVPGRDDLVVDTSETRLRETAEESLAFGQSIDASDAFSSPADPLAFGGIAGPAAADPGPVDATGDAPPGTENPAEEFVEGAASLPFDLPGAALETETAAEAGQSVLDDDLFADFGAGTVGETAVAQGRDRAEQTVGAIRENPAGFAGAVTAGAVVGAGGLSRGSTGTLGQAVRAEVDPRIGPFGRTFETRVVSGARDFLADDRGQAELLTRPEGRESGGSTGETATDDDLGPDVGPFDRSDSRLFDPNREFGDDVGGMQDAGPSVDPSAAESRQDIGPGVGGRGEPGIVGSDAESFSSRGFGDVEGTELDPDPTDTLRDDLDVLGGGAGGLFAAPESDPATGAGVGGLLGAPGDLDATGADPDLGGRTRTVTTPFFDADTFSGPDSDVFERQDTPTDTRQDTPADLFDSPTADTPPADPPTTAPPSDPPSDTPSDPPSDPPTFDTPDDPPERFPPDFGVSTGVEEDSLLTRTDDTTVENPTRTLTEVDQAFVESFDS